MFKVLPAQPLLTLLVGVFGIMSLVAGKVSAETLDQWIQMENTIARDRLIDNISPRGGLPGAIIASTSKSNPNYFFHWVRDAAISIKGILFLYETTDSVTEKKLFDTILKDFVSFSSVIQNSAEAMGIGLGEPKFNIDGSVFLGPWARPQNDGPATRALELIHYAQIKIKEGEDTYVQQNLYDSKLPTSSVIKKDLEYISHHWRETCYDPWEEELGHHFYTQLLMKKALVEGASLASRLGDPMAARWYLQQSALLSKALRRYWRFAQKYLASTLDHQNGISYKVSGLDSSVVIAVLGGNVREDIYPIEDEKVMATLAAQENAFAQIYPINATEREIPGTAIGRYPEDRYDGYNINTIGNPWPSLTIGFAIYCYRLALTFQKQQEFSMTAINNSFFKMLKLDTRFTENETVFSRDPRFKLFLEALKEKGDSYLSRVRYHANPDGTLSEQINRITGFQQGAANLSFNYAGFLLATGARKALIAEL